MESVVRIQRAVGLLAGSQCRYLSHARGLVPYRLALALSQSKQQISDRLACTSGWVLGVVLGKGAVEAEEAAGNVRLRVIVETFFQLAAKLNGVASANQRRHRREVELRVVVLDEAVSLRATHRLVFSDAGRRRGSGCSRDNRVVFGWPADGRQIESGIDGRAGVNESARPKVQMEDRFAGRGKVVFN